MKLNLDDIITGTAFGLCLFIILKWWILLTAPACAILWAMTGAGYGQIYRRLLCAVVVLVPASLQTNVFQCLYSILPIFGVLSLGYGIPDATDKGSFLGRFFYRITKDNLSATVFTRLLLIFLLAVSFAPVYFIDKIYFYTAWYVLSAGKLIAIFGPQKEINI